jgi:hypothetical protein
MQTIPITAEVRELLRSAAGKFNPLSGYNDAEIKARADGLFDCPIDGYAWGALFDQKLPEESISDTLSRIVRFALDQKPN